MRHLFNLFDADLALDKEAVCLCEPQLLPALLGSILGNISPDAPVMCLVVFRIHGLALKPRSHRGRGCSFCTMR